MTGFGEAHSQQDRLVVGVEVRTINSRFFKLAVRTAEGYALLEPRIDALVRRRIRRGTVQVTVQVDRVKSPEDFRINAEVLDRYRRQIESLQQQWGISEVVSLESILALPGVVDEGAGGLADPEAEWPLIAQTLETAMQNLARMRAEEGRVMADDLKANCRAAATSLDRIRHRAPRVADAYRARLGQRVNRALGEYDVVLDAAEVVREVSLFAERSDVSEEIVRLQSHLDQFQTTIDAPDSSGRRLEFLTQEMLRETNTIGSKANDVEIAREVIEIKTAVERIREMVQNIE